MLTTGREINRIVVFDTSVVTENMGDFIVMDYCNKIFNEIFADDFIVRIPTHERISLTTYRYIRHSQYNIVCGTNLLTGRMLKLNQWKLNLLDSLFVKNSCLLGVGWRKYEEKIEPYSRILWNNVLSHTLLHSVRDSYTEKKMRKMGFQNVVNTGCPTMWGLSESFCKGIPSKKSNKVIMTTTRYNQNKEHDENLLDILLRQYDEVYYWVQSLEDYKYALNLKNGDKVKFVSPKLDAYDQILEELDIDYCGTRLHAGIRALNYGRRSIIIATDNRAIEIANDTMLPICKRENIESGLESMIIGDWETTIKLPLDNIEKWKSQFR